jgi:uncharacterized membrane protein YjfL (UPF0719 family)
LLSGTRFRDLEGSDTTISIAFLNLASVCERCDLALSFSLTMNASHDLLPLLDRLGWSLPLFLVAFAALWFAKALYQWTEPFDFANELTENDNPAFGAAIAGYLLGAAIALTAAFPRNPALDLTSLLSAVELLAVLGVLVALLMRASVWMVAHGGAKGTDTF